MTPITFDCMGCGKPLTFSVPPWAMCEVRGRRVGCYYYWEDDPADGGKPIHVCDPTDLKPSK